MHSHEQRQTHRARHPSICASITIMMMAMRDTNHERTNDVCQHLRSGGNRDREDAVQVGDDEGEDGDAAAWET